MEMDQCVSILEGCTDELACNYNSDANTDDDTCEYPNTNADCNGDCLDGFVLVQGGGNGDGTGNGDGSGQCISILEGCTDELACNYNFDANTDDEHVITQKLILIAMETVLQMLIVLVFVAELPLLMFVGNVMEQFILFCRLLCCIRRCRWRY